MLLLPGMVKAEEADDMPQVVDDGLVKVYMFEAGGCPYCEQELAYLQSLESYGTKFTVVSKELYVDHNTWAQGEDYELGQEVAKAFNAAGFTQAKANGTPMIIISDVYASTGYDDNLEEVIDLAYQEGDKDVVSCIANGGKECIAAVEQKKLTVVGAAVLIGSVVVVFGIIICIYLYTDNKNKKAK